MLPTPESTVQYLFFDNLIGRRDLSLETVGRTVSFPQREVMSLTL
jgi:hypothetical protein